MSKNGLENNLYTYDQVIEIFGGVLAESLKKLDKLQPMKIVRCKDCKHMIINKNHEAKPMICCLTKMCGTTDADWFCADGERKENERT